MKFNMPKFKKYKWSELKTKNPMHIMLLILLFYSSTWWLIILLNPIKWMNIYMSKVKKQ